MIPYIDEQGEESGVTCWATLRTEDPELNGITAMNANLRPNIDGLENDDPP